MLRRLGSASSAESSTVNQSSSRLKQKRMGVWLSLNSSRNYTCPLCNRGFCSLQGMGGHQNAHRDIQIAMQEMHMKILEEEKKRKVLEKMRIHPHTSPVRAIASPTAKKASRTALASALVASDPTQIDLDLRLGCGPPNSNKVMTFYEFMPIKKGGKGNGAGAPSGSGVNMTYARTIPYPDPAAFGELAQVPVPVRGGFGAGAGGFLEASDSSDELPLADPYVGWLPGRSGTNKVTCKTGLDVTLKL